MPKRDKYHPDYTRLYPGVTITPEVMDVLKCSDRKMEYMEVDLKNDSTRQDPKTQTSVFIPRREDSLERMHEENHMFTSITPSPEDKAIHNDELDRLQRALGMLEVEEYTLIDALYYKGISQKALARKIGITQQGISKRLKKIYGKINSFMKI